jgi:hypothetical protein
MPGTKKERGTSRRITALEAECDRLRGLLSIARNELTDIVDDLRHLPNGMRDRAYGALHRSDPDASPEDA